MGVVALLLVVPASWSGLPMLLGAAATLLGYAGRRADSGAGKAIVALVLGLLAMAAYLAVYVSDWIANPGAFWEREPGAGAGWRHGGLAHGRLRAMSEYQQSAYPPPMPPQNHPRAVTILVLGICGLLICGCSGRSRWSMGNKALREIDASGGRLGGRDTVNVGRILGIITTALWVIGLVVTVGLVVLAPR